MTIETKRTITVVDGWDAKTFVRLVGEARQIVLVAHTNADGDAVGSVTGMFGILRHVAPHAVLHAMLPDGLPGDYDWLPGSEFILSGRSDMDACRSAIANADLIIGLDIAGLNRTGTLEPLLRDAHCGKILIDHHEAPRREDFDVVVSDPGISSTCELVYWLCRMLWGCEVIDRDVATSLYTGLCTDTGTFSYSNRRASLYIAAAEMTERGIDPMAINQRIKNVFTPARLQFFGYAISQLLTVDATSHTALMVIAKEDMERYGVTSHELTGLVNEVMRLRDTECAILIREEEGLVRLSLRSKTTTDVNRLAQELFDGGGHERAAGATSHLSLQATVERVKEAIKKMTLAIVLLLAVSCGDVPVVELPTTEGDALKENRMGANRLLAEGEETQIASYIARRGWTTTTLMGGTRVMVTEEGHGAKIDYDDTVHISYSIAAIDGSTVYTTVSEQVVAGRHKPCAGVDAALLTLRRGSKAKIIVPSLQAFGVPGDGDRIGSRMTLIYDLTVK